MPKLSTQFLLFVVALLAIAPLAGSAQDQGFKTIEFDSSDGLSISADLYMAHEAKGTPFIVLCHQAGWSRGEYREIAPKLNKMGFNCMAIDQRSGGAVNGVTNETFERAKQAGKPNTYVDAEPDIIAAVKHAKQTYAEGKLILWGSSYSSALVLRISGENPGMVDGTLSFAPGEYFTSQQKPKDWIASSAKKIKSPAFITSAKNEYRGWKSIFEAIEAEGKAKFLPETKGNHGSRALWKKFDDNDAYWEATSAFLKKFL